MPKSMRCSRAWMDEEVIAGLERADIANARLNSMEEFWRHPQLEARGRWVKVGSPAGELDALKPPFNISRDGAAHGADPGGRRAHAARSSRSSGYGPAEIERLAAEGVI